MNKQILMKVNNGLNVLMIRYTPQNNKRTKILEREYN